MGKKSPKILPAAAVFGQFLALFPFAAAFCGLALKRYAVLAYLAVYAVFAVFYAAGHLCGRFAHEMTPGGKRKSVIMFISRAAVLVPSALFIAGVLAFDLPSMALFYVLPGGIAAFFGAHGGEGRSYTDKFSRGWFALYFAAGLFTAVLLWSSREEELAADGMLQLCAGFAVMILLSALLANQTNIDVCTNQRGGGRSVLPDGLRRYNAVLITVICAVTIGLFLFAKPLAGLIKYLVSLLIRGFLSVMEALSSCVWIEPEDMTPDGSGNVSEIEPGFTSALAELLFAVLIIGLLVVIFKLRRQIWELIKSVFEPLFRAREKSSDIPFYDEILVSDAKRLAPRARRRVEHELAKQYKRESDPARRYRLGYALFLVRLGKTERPPLPVDTTTVHREKGESVFERDLGELSGVYNRVRYGETAPTAEELAEQEKLLTELK
ncbi:MAG: hypothetical protein HDT43_13510 [Ruminococcaceae bacterium]|nr:hypothetical protein [Oscillospiraceae bacterium]